MLNGIDVVLNGIGRTLAVVVNGFVCPVPNVRPGRLDRRARLAAVMVLLAVVCLIVGLVFGVPALVWVALGLVCGAGVPLAFSEVSRPFAHARLVRGALPREQRRALEHGLITVPDAERWLRGQQAAVRGGQP